MEYETDSLEKIKEALLGNISDAFSQVQNFMPIRALYLKQTIFTVFFLVIGLVFSIIAGIGDFTHNKTLFINYSLALVVCILITLTVYNFYFLKIKRLLPDMKIISVAVQIVCAAIPLSFYFLFSKIFPDTVIEIIYSIIAFGIVLYGVISNNIGCCKKLLKKIVTSKLLNQCNFIKKYYRLIDEAYDYSEIEEYMMGNFGLGDSWKGNYRGYKFRIYDIENWSLYEAKYGKRESYKFKGVLFCFELGEKSLPIPFKILKTSKKIRKKVDALFSILIAVIFLIEFYFTHRNNDMSMNALCLFCAFIFIYIAFELTKNQIQQKDKALSIKFKPKRLSQKKIKIFSNNLNFANTFVNEELLQCYFNMKKIFKADNIDIIAQRKTVYVIVENRKHFLELSGLFSLTNPLKQIEAFVYQVVLFMYLIDIFDRRIKSQIS